MNKPVLFAFLLFLVITMTVIATEINTLAMDQVTPSSDVSENNLATDSFTLGYLEDVANTWFRMVTFRLAGMPNIIILVVFYPLNGMVLYMLIEILIKIIF